MAKASGTRSKANAKIAPKPISASIMSVLPLSTPGWWCDTGDSISSRCASAVT